jgi:hypothetical protein
MSKVIAPFGMSGEALVAGLTLNFTESVAVADVSAADARRLRAQGFTVVEYEPESAPATVALPPGADDRPARNASKSDWVDYAVLRGHTPESLEDKTRDQIVALFE